MGSSGVVVVPPAVPVIPPGSVYRNGALLGSSMTWVLGASLVMYWYDSRSGLSLRAAAINSSALASASAWIRRASASPLARMTARRLHPGQSGGPARLPAS